MRLVGITNEASRAEGFANFLQDLGTASVVRPENSGFGIWVIDEDRLPGAKKEWTRFVENPGHPDFLTGLPRALPEMVEQEPTAQTTPSGALSADAKAAAQRGETSVRQPTPTTLMIAIAMISVSVLTKFGDDKNDLFWRLTFGPEIADQKVGAFDPKDVWRAITPIFLHLSVIQFLFYLLMFQEMAGQVEQRLGRAKLIFLVMIFSFVSNMAEGYFGPSRMFGGMAGLVFGLFGFIWMRVLYAPWTGFTMSSSTILLMAAWFFMSLVSHVMPAANWSLSFGFCSGVVLGVFAPAGLKPAQEVAPSSNPAP